MKDVFKCIVSNQLAATNTKCPSVKNRILSDSYDGCILCVLFQICVFIGESTVLYLLWVQILSFLYLGHQAT